MRQTIYMPCNGSFAELCIPSPREELLPCVPWGRADVLFTPAYWKSQYWLHGQPVPESFRLGDSLLEETAACLLGGHGVPAEVGLAAFERVKASGLLVEAALSEIDLVAPLSEPLMVRGRSVRYRFARQRARYLHAARTHFHESAHPPSGHELRDWLMQIPGVGFKTASWIVRNWTGTDEVAILDIHIIRACLLAGLLKCRPKLPGEYLRVEAAFLRFAKAIDISPAALDAFIWAHFKRFNRLALAMLGHGAKADIGLPRSERLVLAQTHRRKSNTQRPRKLDGSVVANVQGTDTSRPS